VAGAIFAVSTFASIGALAVAVAGCVTDIAALDGVVSGLTATVGVHTDEITALQAKTFYQSVFNLNTYITNCSLCVGSLIGGIPSAFCTIDKYGNVTSISVKTSDVDTPTINSSNTGNLTIANSSTPLTTINGKSINIGTVNNLATNTVNIGTQLLLVQGIDVNIGSDYSKIIMNGSYIEIGKDNILNTIKIGNQTGTVQLQGTPIKVGTDSVFNNNYVGNVSSNVYIAGAPSSAISIPNFINQFA